MIYIVVPTYHRLKKLERCINSIRNNSFKNWRLVIVADNQDVESVKYGQSIPDDRIVEVTMQTNHQFVVAANNYFWNKYQDTHFEGMLMLCDDVELDNKCLENVVDTFRLTYPDTDGVVGISQKCEGHDNYTWKWFGQTLIGKKFASRYPNYQVSCKDYLHFYTDEEMYEYAKSLNKFTECPSAVLNHDHPSFTGSVDETHNIIRSSKVSPKSKDIVTYNLRKSKGLVWGKTFELVNK